MCVAHDMFLRNAIFGFAERYVFLRKTLRYLRRDLISGRAHRDPPLRTIPLPLLFQERWHTKCDGEVNLIQSVTESHRTFSLFTFTYYFLLRTVGDAGPYNISCLPCIHSPCLPQTREVAEHSEVGGSESY